jgi:hypothetical protein
VTRAATACTAAAILLVVAGCKHPQSPQAAATTTTTTATTTTDSAPTLHLLTPQDIDRYPAGSPQHALLSWWRSAQFIDYQGYLQSFASGFRQTLRSDPKTRRALLVLGGFLTASTVKFLDVEQDGPDAVTLYTEVRYQARNPDGTVATSTLPRAFRMIRQGGAWRLQDDSFVQQTLPASLRRS